VTETLQAVATQTDAEKKIKARSEATAIQRFLRNPEVGALFAVLVVAVGLTIANEHFLTASNLMLVARGFSFVAIAGMGATLVMITSGIDLSVGSVMGLAGIVAAFLSARGMGAATAVLGALATGVVIGFFNGFLITKAKMAPFIVTLGTLGIGRGFVYVITGGWPLQGFSDAALFLGQGFVLGVPVPVWIMAVLLVLWDWVLRRTTFGWYIYSMGGNEEAARLSGVPVDRTKILVYVLSGMMGALGGFLLTARLGLGECSAGLGYELDVIAACVIGGVSLSGGEGNVLGVVVGAALMGLLRNGLALLGVSAFWQQIVIGSIIILAVLVDRIRVTRAASRV
jgi:ribose transport system permease protein